MGQYAHHRLLARALNWGKLRANIRTFQVVHRELAVCEGSCHIYDHIHTCQVEIRAETVGLIGVQNKALALGSCVTLGKLISLS